MTSIRRAILPVALVVAGCSWMQPAPPSAVPPPAPQAVAPAPPAVAAKPPPVLPPAKPPPSAPSAKPPAAPVAAKPPPPALDLVALEQRLKSTDAIGVLTKLSLKNQVDDLVARFKSFHEGRRPPTLTELRPSFELLLMKVLSLLQDRDERLARDIDASREALWSVLADREKLAKYL